jgi:tyrosinase
MSNKKTRRDFLITLGSGAAVGLMQPTLARAFDVPAPASAALRIRRDVTSAAAQKDLDTLRRGVAAMKKLIASNPKDPRGWVLQAYLHGNCTQFTFCQHGNWYFPAWHRVFIYYFEQLIQYFGNDPDFALPYWDWSRTWSVPGSFYGSGNPLDDDVSIRSSCSGAPTAGRGRSQTDTFSKADLDTYVGPAVISRIQSNPDYASYGGANPGRGALEATPHNFVHRWVGGAKSSNMVQTFSPLDPIFWLHHCNIDRLYSDWLGRPDHKPPVDQPAWRDKSFNDFFDASGKPAGGQWTCGQTVDSGVMGYRYDRVLGLPKAMLERVSPARAPKVVQTVVSGRGMVKAGVATFAAAAVAQTESRQLLNAAAVSPRRYAVRLTLSGLQTPAQQNTGVHVFLGADIAAGTPLTAPGYVGSITYFDGQGEAKSGQHHGSQGIVILDATEAFQTLYGDGGVPEGHTLTVSLLTRALFDGVESFASVDEVQPAQATFEILELAD